MQQAAAGRATAKSNEVQLVPPGDLVAATALTCQLHKAAKAVAVGCCASNCGWCMSLHAAAAGRPRGGALAATYRAASRVNNTPLIQCSLLLPQYIVVDTLGRGSFGKVKLCLNTGNDMLCAVKVVSTKLVSAVCAGLGWWRG